MDKKLKGNIIERKNLTDTDIELMYELMETFYDQVTKENFLNDLSQKDYCIILKDETEKIWGFSTQQILHIPFRDKEIQGVFSGDTIIHKDYWGSMELFIAFAKFFFEFEKEYADFYWFLICKGYKTYRMLPTFFKEFYPNYRKETPEEMKQIIDAFGTFYSKEEYDENTGILSYKGYKDRLKEHVADITESVLKNKDSAFFVERNPNHVIGHDMVCLTKLSRSNLHRHAEQFLFR